MRRFLVGLSVALAALTGIAAPALAEPGPSETPWSDCIYDTPQPSATSIVYVYTSPSRIILNCGGVRHIKIGHGFDNYTEGCVGGALRYATKPYTSKTDSNNWVYLYEIEKRGLQSYSVYVVVSKVYHTIVTAYVSANDGESENWETCWEKFN